VLGINPLPQYSTPALRNDDELKTRYPGRFAFSLPNPY
jgi:hypothetical protein